MDFAPLHIYSSYSLLKSGLDFDRIFKSAKKNKINHLGICDFNTLSGIPEFYSLCLKNDIKPLIGCDINVKYNDTNLTISLFCTDEESYLSLVKIVSSINNNQSSLENIKNELKSLVCVLPTFTNSIEFLLNEPKKLFDFNKLFKDFYLGIENYSNKNLDYINRIRAFAANHSYKKIAFPLVKYQKHSDEITIEILDAIANDKLIEVKEKSGDNFFPSNDLMNLYYEEDELNNSIKLVESSSFNFDVKRGSLLKFSNNSKEILTSNCLRSLKFLNIDDDIHNDRLRYEIDVISQMGYCDYFLIVADYVKFAKENNILVGPGRGSAAGSLVSYLLGITMIDPLKYDLLFERFLNKERVTMPDIDIDFEDIKREKIINYLIQKYGRERVANIITYQSIGAKQSLRDIGRVYQYPSRDIDILAKAIPNNKIDLHSAYIQVPAFKNLVDSDDYYLEIVRLAAKIEGLKRQSSLHAAGIILNNDDISLTLPINKDSEGNIISQYEMNYLESQGFLKMDILGLRNLTIIHKCLDLIKENKNIELKYENIPYDIPEIYEMISKGLTSGIFQLESSGIKKAIEKLQPSNFDDIVALLALFRPGPMDSIEDYAKRKSSITPVSYIVKELEPILKSTYGIIIYQEQIMQITQVIAGFTLSQADIFRRAISKKDASKMEMLKNDFISGAVKNGFSYQIGEKIYERILKFADYGFNKSHSVSYAVITCQMAYLKYKYPYEFYIALLEIGSSNNDTKFSEYISEFKKQGYTIYLPDINVSTIEFKIHKNGLIIPFSSIRGIKLDVMQAIIYEREKNGLFKDLLDFTYRLMPYGINDLQIIRLIDAGCFDSLCPSRASLRGNVPNAIRYAMLFGDDKQQMSLLTREYSERPRFIEYKDNELENFELEYEALGFTVSKTILHYKKEELENKGIKDIDYILTKNSREPFACLLKSKKIINTKKGQPMAFLKVFDESNELEVTLFPETYAKYLMTLETNSVFIIKGYYQKDKQSFIAETITLLEDEQ